MQAIQHIYAPEQQDLSAGGPGDSNTAQHLGRDLQHQYEMQGKRKLIKEASAEVQKHPKWRRALKEGGIELIKFLCAPIGIPLEMARVYWEE
jgi:type VI protein secretion system component VasK